MLTGLPIGICTCPLLGRNLYMSYIATPPVLPGFGALKSSGPVLLINPISISFSSKFSWVHINKLPRSPSPGPPIKCSSVLLRTRGRRG
jgi:hypothetical protein